MSIRIVDITAERLAQTYPPATARTIANQFTDYQPYMEYFPPFNCYVGTDNTGAQGLFAEITLPCGTVQHHQQQHQQAPQAAGGGVGAASSASKSDGVRVVLSFPREYPNQVVHVQVLPPAQGSQRNLRVKQPYPVMDTEGVVQVECLTMLRGAERPYPIMSVLLALTEQFNLESPYTSLQQQQQQQLQLAQGSGAAIANVLTSASQNPQRTAFIQQAAEAIVINLNEKASAYLETREQALSYLHRLSESNTELTRSRDLLAKHKRSLEECLPSVGDVDTLVRKLETMPNTVEERSRCLVAQTVNQEKALALLAEIHASDDLLAVLEDGFKGEYFTVEEYVKCVSDVGREQFISRFLCQRVLKELNASGQCVPAAAVAAASVPNNHDGPSSPAVPVRLTPKEALLVDFPHAAPDIIEDVLRNVNNDVGEARQQLRTMFAA